jgi:hypothetical protein
MRNIFRSTLTIVVLSTLSCILPRWRSNTTVVILNWSRLSNVQKIVSEICTYALADPVHEIIVWNNSPTRLSFAVSIGCTSCEDSTKAGYYRTISRRQHAPVKEYESSTLHQICIFKHALWRAHWPAHLIASSRYSLPLCLVACLQPTRTASRMTTTSSVQTSFVPSVGTLTRRTYDPSTYNLLRRC